MSTEQPESVPAADTFQQVLSVLKERGLSEVQERGPGVGIALCPLCDKWLKIIWGSDGVLLICKGGCEQEAIIATPLLADQKHLFGDWKKEASATAESEFSVPDLMRKLGWKKSTTYTVLSRAEEIGAIASSGTYGRYVFQGADDAGPLDLPDTV